MLTKRQRIVKSLKRSLLFFTGECGRGVPCFIFGAQRSGTNMVIDILKKSKSTECFDENDEEAFDNYVLRDFNTTSMLVKKSRAKAIIFKPICDSQNAAQILDYFKNSRAVWIYRHYYDNVNSAMKNWKDHKYLYYMLHDHKKARWRIENVSPEDMELVRRYYNVGISDASTRALVWYLRNRLFFQQKLDENPRVLLINYEKLVDSPNIYFQKIFLFLGLEFFSIYSQNVFRSSIGKNKQPVLDQEIDGLCRNLFDKLENQFIEQNL